MRLLRDRLSDALHIRKEDHLTYGFHLTIGYLLRFLTKDQEKELRTLLTDHFKGMPKQFQLGAPEFCTFEDMFAYEPLLYLKTRYPSGVPYKFGPDGSVQHYPGNTIISHLSPSSESGLHDSLLALSGKLQSSPLGHLYALLPSTSWHMTIFDGVLDQVRKPGRWPDDISLNASLEECTALYQNKLSSFDLQCDPPYHMSIKGFKPLEGTIGLHLEPYTTEEDAQMRDLRDRLSDTLHIRKEDQTTYGFYLTLGYLLRFLTEQQEKELNKLLYDHFESMPKQFALGGPEFCTFENMYSFTPLVYLTDQ
ncbi:RNA ligase/cyclic nucleotide phosphodiesterase [Mycena capillaripes]|nr:RNA ligase/cyclic nucleotide phosphodiesterase [Mycena capillaripes]